MFKYVKFTKVETVDTVLEFRGESENVKVNHFDVDVVSISSEDESAIDALIASQPSEINCKEIEQGEFKTLVSGSSQYKRIINRVSEFFDTEMQELVVSYPALERETWNTQVNQAKAYKASSDESDAPFLKILADNENSTVADFADAVISKANTYEQLSAQKLSKKRAFERELLEEIGL